MNRVFVTILAIVFSLPFIFFIGNFILWSSLSGPRISPRQMERIFVADYDLLRVVVNYLEASEHESININQYGFDGLMFVGLRYGNIPISDEQVIETITTLHNRGYRTIGKSGNTIRFLRSTRGRDFGNGIVFSVDGNEPVLNFLTRLEPLPELNWYYYEEDFNEWRVRQRE